MAVILVLDSARAAFAISSITAAFIALKDVPKQRSVRFIVRWEIQSRCDISRAVQLSVPMVQAML